MITQYNANIGNIIACFQENIGIADQCGETRQGMIDFARKMVGRSDFDDATISEGITVAISAGIITQSEADAAAAL